MRMGILTKMLLGGMAASVVGNMVTDYRVNKNPELRRKLAEMIVTSPKFQQKLSEGYTAEEILEMYDLNELTIVKAEEFLDQNLMFLR